MTIDDENAIITRIALYWDDDICTWSLLSVGKDEQEINERVKFWKGKGVNKIKVFNTDNRLEHKEK